MGAASLATVPGWPQAQAVRIQAAEALTNETCKQKVEAGIDTAVSKSAALTVPDERTLLRNTFPRRPVEIFESVHDACTPAGLYSFSVCTAMATGSIAESEDGVSPAARAGSSNYASTEQASKRVCILLHGFMGDKEDWLPIMRALALTHHCIAVDLPGHGNTVVTPAGQSYS